MSTLQRESLTSVLQLIAFGLAGPLVVGITKQTRAKLEGRAGAGILQPWREIAKLWSKQSLTPISTTVMFKLAPYILAATSIAIIFTGPFLATQALFGSSADLLAMVGLLFLGNISLALAGLDTASAFGGMGASRELTVSSLVEPTILVAIFALSIPARSSSLASIVLVSSQHPSNLFTPASLLALCAFLVVVVAEAKRMPVDNPSTHLELTMIHEAMILEYSGPRLAIVEWSSSIRLTLLLGLVSNLFFPIGIWSPTEPLWAVAVSIVALSAKVVGLCIVLAVFELTTAKIRLFRIPDLLTGSFILALLSVISSYLFSSAVR